MRIIGVMIDGDEEQSKEKMTRENKPGEMCVEMRIFLFLFFFLFQLGGTTVSMHVQTLT